MDPGDVVALAVSRGDLGDDLVEGERGGIDDARSRRRGGDDFARHQRAGVKADQAALDQAQPAHRDQVGSAGSGADEMHRHSGVPSK